MAVFWAVLLVIFALVCWALNLLSIPGNWLLIAAAALYAWLGPSEPPLDLGWGLIAALVLLAAFGELIEFAAGALGATKAGGSKRGAALALFGSLAGGVVGMLVGVPIPVVGPVVGALLFASGGALAGAMLGEYWKGRELHESWRIGQAAFWGRLLGTLGKILVGGVMLAVLIAALFVR